MQTEVLSIDYYDTPKFHWSVSIEGHNAYQDNAIVQSPFDDNILYVTTHQADFAVVSASDGYVKGVVGPTPRTFSEDGQLKQWTTTCHSGPIFGEFANGTQFMAYAVTDTPPAGSELALKT